MLMIFFSFFQVGQMMNDMHQLEKQSTKPVEGKSGLG